MVSRLIDLPSALWSRGAAVGLSPEGASLALALRGCGRTMVIVPTYQDTLSLCSDLKILGHAEPFLLDMPPLDAQKLAFGDSFLRRGQIISEWQNCADGILVTTPGGAVTPFRFSKAGLSLECGKEIGREKLMSWLLKNGYHRTELVWQTGEFSARGGIIDVFDPSEMAPVRIEFFDEEIDSMRFFQPRTQRSFRHINEYVLRSAFGDDGAVNPSFWQGARLVLVRPQKLEESFYSFADLYNALVPEDEKIPSDGYESLIVRTSALPRLRVVPPGDGSAREVLGIGVVPYFRGSVAAAKAYVKTSLEKGYGVNITSRTLFGSSFPEGVKFFKGVSLSGGAVLKDTKEVWLSDAELFGIEDVAPDEVDLGMPLDLEASLKENQYAVHERYGVCRLVGTSTEKFNGQDYETIVLQFARDEKLIIPTSELFRLTPWNGDGEPELDSLSSKRWRSAWKKAEEQIEAEAQGLLSLYAERELAQGYAFPKDGDLLRRFEENFPYKETADQLRAIRDVKRDMERQWPMDRLIVGDVGYGKTEVALRAAVKAAENGKQVAIAVPTTVLALQHFRTCAARIGDLPIRVELLSRMVPPSKQKNILSDVASGGVDIIIGTHRLFQGDISFKDLGLLIIDEEHRFGVRHKEHLKRLHTGLDVLSLSATPIPRSLSMALRGIRDISVISTPPRSRGEVFTVTAEWDQSLAYDAIMRELMRGGQVYYLHNRVGDIEEIAAKLANRFAGHSVAIAHGQMNERDLENTMNDFYDGRTEILVCTTIIESGLDVPKANTLIVDDVRHLGLAQMHQIRGRIGRRSESAYALLFYKSDSASGATRERLEAFGAASSQNGGYQLAQRDLEIRGAGEILGTEQHGFKERIGYTLYLKKLRERVEQMRGADANSVSTDISVPLRIPIDYIPQADLRIGLYRRLLSKLAFGEYDEIKDELRDRYGPIPEQVMGLLDAALVRGEGGRSGMRALKVTPLLLSIEGDVRGDMFRRPRWIEQNGSKVGVGGIKGLSLVSGELQRMRGELCGQ